MRRVLDLVERLGDGVGGDVRRRRALRLSARVVARVRGMPLDGNEEIPLGVDVPGIA